MAGLIGAERHSCVVSTLLEILVDSSLRRGQEGFLEFRFNPS